MNFDKEKALKEFCLMYPNWNPFSKTKNVPYKAKKYAKKYRLKNKFKINARKKVYIELRAGRIIKQKCEDCGEEKTEAHHKDYSKPLNIVWLCKKHHIEHDKLDKSTIHKRN